MEKVSGGNLDAMSRRLSAVKVVVDLFNHELDLGKADKALSFERERFEASVTTLEMFVGDLEGLLRGGSGSDGRRVIETSRASSRVN